MPVRAGANPTVRPISFKIEQIHPAGIDLDQRLHGCDDQEAAKAECTDCPSVGKGSL